MPGETAKVLTKMSAILAIDPGPTQSAAVVYVPGGEVMVHWLKPNQEFVVILEGFLRTYTSAAVVIEQFACYGMPIGRECLNTITFSGYLQRVIEEVSGRGPQWMPRVQVKAALCRSARAKDSNVRQVLIDIFGGSREAAIGKKAKPGPLYGIHGDEWAALALAVAFGSRLGRTE